MYIRTARLKALWEVAWSDLSTISLENNGISLVLRGGVVGPFLTIQEESMHEGVRRAATRIHVMRM